MPNLDGACIANVARRLNPGIRILAVGVPGSGSLCDAARWHEDAPPIEDPKAEVLLNSFNNQLRAAPSGAAGPP